MTADRAVQHRGVFARAVEEAYGPLIEQGLSEAADFDGVDHEIRLLRLWLYDTVKRAAEKEENAEDADKQSKSNTEKTTEVMLRTLGQIIRAVEVRYRLSPKDKKDFAAHLAGVLDHMADGIKRADEEGDL